MAKNTAKSNTFRTSKEKKDKAKKAKFSFGFFKDPRLKLAFGFFLLLTSVFLLTAFVSYLFTGKADQSIVMAGGDRALIESGKEAKNWLGLYGAIVSHYFIFRWFGISAFFIPPLLFAWSFRILFHRSIVRLASVFTFCLFATLWLSLLLGYMTRLNDGPGEWAYLGGGLGDAMAEVFQSMFGWGTFLVLILSLFIFIIYFFNVTALSVLHPRNPKPMGNDAIPGEESDTKSSGYTDEGDNWPDIVAKTRVQEPEPLIPESKPEPKPEPEPEVKAPAEKPAT
ncbi:MAG: DNA translocase FtsK 4TM domain-containing protein, partial [Cyclobacteriaceae bacterium]|nr:DNA translocase FtsK 4TM domain-containing protein [Cyclobacteriaceae bacterium]